MLAEREPFPESRKPDLPRDPLSGDVPPTVVTAINGYMTKAGQHGNAVLVVLHGANSNLNTGSSLSKRDLSLKKRRDYEQLVIDNVADPTGTGFINVLYEYNNDATYNPQIKCATYGHAHSRREDQSREGIHPTEIDSSTNPTILDGYAFAFGPTNTANQAPDFIGFAILDKYDVQTYTDQCNTHDPDPYVCHYSNVYRAIFNGNPIN
ncbi:hypothetical protein BDN72DRAFT_862778 [Pluteus cervinus]|uniref:Uncharacterized protein n=1 Tax=Pluteus cervinus TaxID=181527 RepID=A0ACD3A9H7_9AGAR|nr:hypothetical protein BDN72DRAFT_862778 [Pluteus cervinus]